MSILTRRQLAHLATHHLLPKATAKMPLETKATITTFGGKLFKLSHPSTVTSTPMNLNLYVPPSALSSKSTPNPAPVLIYLSGLTCSPENCSEKGFFQHRASQLGLAIVYPDTSPRGLAIPGQNDSWDFGEAAGFYLDATADPWKQNYRMESYITEELPKVLFEDEEYGKYLDGSRVSITGHSMGGHGALTLYLKHQGKYKSVSAFAPIANPTKCPWGEKAFKGYLAGGVEEGKKHDAVELLRSGIWKGGDLKALVDVGTGDNFYKNGQLLPENLEEVVKEKGLEGVRVRYHEGYDHSYYFMASFSGEHVEHAAKHLELL
ncbi:putative S-formylglutathione hydrolase [Triangularia setosa]|uniref:S-formylglutathione hydrolase n=1 Tax=Triangularia setosa TaxID=2587417 RepID=A0AAN7A1I3_9PEZI|nr:putative S-formylglutathione hydrolase [Podospora setosa]